VPVSVVIFDLDDTLVEDVRTADSSFEEVRRRLTGGVDGESDGGEGGEGGGDGGERGSSGSWETMRDAVRAVWQRGADYELCVALGFASWEGLWSTFEGNHPILDGLQAWQPTFRREAWTAALATLGLHDPDLVASAEEIFTAAQIRGHAPLPGAVETVRRVSAGHRLGILTNGPSDIQRLKLEGSGLAAQFECVAISGEMGVGKPKAAAFGDILGQLDVSPQDAVMVGDSWERDIEGAHGCGLRAVWIAWGRPVPAQLQGVRVVQTIEGVADLLGCAPSVG
jgi:putative hydrolase of the HAD superfamily